MDFSTGTAESCNYSRMGRTILDCSEDTSPSPGTPANPIMICQSCHNSIHDGETWQLEAETGLLFFNFFGKRSEHVFQNHQLPGRRAA